jgi:hypothetical protein
MGIATHLDLVRIARRELAEMDARIEALRRTSGTLRGTYRDNSSSERLRVSTPLTVMATRPIAAATAIAVKTPPGPPCPPSMNPKMNGDTIEDARAMLLHADVAQPRIRVGYSSLV